MVKYVLEFSGHLFSIDVRMMKRKKKKKNGKKKKIILVTHNGKLELTGYSSITNTLKAKRNICQSNPNQQDQKNYANRER